MPELTPPVEQELISCDICLKTIPRESAEPSETEDYVAYFCGLDCYDEWAKQKPELETSNTE